MTRLTTMAAMPARTALAIGDVRMSVIALDPDACPCGCAAPPPSISRSCPGFACKSVSTWPRSFGSGATCRGSVTPRAAGSVLQHLHECRSLFRRQLAQRLLRRLSILVRRHRVRHFTVTLQNLLIGVALG